MFNIYIHYISNQFSLFLLLFISSAIALILLHKLNGEDPTHPKENFDGLIASAGTLIITPSAIIRQWESEFKRHAPLLRVTTYQGIKAAGKNQTSITAEELAKYDVVLTDYNVCMYVVNMIVLIYEYISLFNRNKAILFYSFVYLLLLLFL